MDSSDDELLCRVPIPRGKKALLRSRTDEVVVVDSSDDELICSAPTPWERKVLDIDQNKLWSQNPKDVDVNELPDSRSLKVLLQKFGHKKFRPLQWKIIKSVLIDKEDICAIMATGYGKSLCYQFPAVYSGGITIVISPLISLMEDQVLALTMKNISSCLLGSAQTNKNVTTEILENKYSIIYLTPEFCTGEYGIDILRSMHSKLKIVLIAVDEAHCVSHWGHDFRPSYNQLRILKDIFVDIPILAVTATATEPVKKDIVKMLNLKYPQILCTGYDRPNLYFSVRPKSSSILADLKSLMFRKAGKWVFEGSTIIYCITRKDTEVISSLLKSCEIATLTYHAGMSLKARKEAHEDFVKDKVPIIVATVAFGMGIDKPDIRNIIHYGSPSSMESYYQEVGRAGRDGLPSKCVAFNARQDFTSREFLIQQGKNKNNMFALLDVIKEYLATRECRRQFILSYFKSSMDLNLPSKKDCCDNCSEKNGTPDHKLYEGLDNKDMYDFTEDAVKFLSAVDTMNGKCGVAKYILFLKGSSNKLLSNWRKHSLYGSGHEKSDDWWRAIANFLEMKQYLKKSSCDVGPRLCFVVGISEKGRRFLKEGSCIKLIERPTPDILKLLTKKQRPSGWISIDRPSSSNTRKTFTTAESNINTGKSTSLETREAADDKIKLFRLLKNCRAQLAAENDCKPYMIVSDFVLLELAKHRPYDLLGLHNMQIEGLTEAIIDKFGADLLKVIRDNTDQCIYSQNPKVTILDVLRDYPIENSKQSETVMTTYHYFKAGMPLKVIAAERGLAYSTICNHLTLAMKMGFPIKMELLGVNLRARTIIVQVINNLGGQHSLCSRIMSECPDEITYEQVNVVRAYLEVREHLHKIGMPYEEFENFIFKENSISPVDSSDVDMNYGSDKLLLALCDAMEKEMGNDNDPNMLNRGNDVNVLENASVPTLTQEYRCKKIKLDPDPVLNSPPKEFPNYFGENDVKMKCKIVEVTEQKYSESKIQINEITQNIVLNSSSRNFSDDVVVEDTTIDSKPVESIDQKGSQLGIQPNTNIEIAVKTKKNLPRWLSSKRKL